MEIKELTAKEEEVMRYFWDNGPMFVKQLVEYYPHTKPHFNTLSTYVRFLEDKGFLSHEALGTTYRYFAIITEEEYKSTTLNKVVRKYFDNSYMSVVSSFIKEESLSIEEIRGLLDEVEKENNSQT